MKKRLINHGIAILVLAVLAFLAIASGTVPAVITDDDKDKNKNYDEAVAAFTNTINRSPSAGAYNSRGVAHYYLGKYDLAIADFEAALRLDRSNTNARSNLEHTRLAQARTGTVMAQNTPGQTQAAPAPTQNSEADFRAGVTQDGTGVVILEYVGNTTAVRIPATVQGLPVREIGERAFQRKSSITSVVIPEGVTIIRHGWSGYMNVGAFAGCSNLTSVTLPESLVTVGGYAFNGCRSLTSIILPESLALIGDYAFFDSGLRSISIPGSVTSIGQGAFRGSGLTSITWPGGIPIPGEIFRNCENLQSVVIPEGITIIRSEAFAFCPALTSITLPSTIREIAEQAFYSCSSLTTITIPNTVERISFAYPPPFGHSVFSGCRKLSLATQAVLRRLGYTGDF